MMGRFSFVNGLYVRHAEAGIHIDDRGYQLADGIYEVVPVEEGVPIDLKPHFERMHYSLGALKIDAPFSDRSLIVHILELIQRNKVKRGIVYIQITRGIAPREHKFPHKKILPSIIITTKEMALVPQQWREEGVKIISIPDERWARCDIKSISLLPNVLGKQKAAEAGAYEAWQIDSDGYVTEGTSSNAWIVTRGKEIRTHPLNSDILGGIVRKMAMEIAKKEGLSFIETPFFMVEALAAEEAFLSSSTNGILPISTIDGHKIGRGCAGPITQQLANLYKQHVDRQIKEASYAD